jgi:hypothetical protein
VCIGSPPRASLPPDAGEEAPACCNTDANTCDLTCDTNTNLCADGETNCSLNGDADCDTGELDTSGGACTGTTAGESCITNDGCGDCETAAAQTACCDAILTGWPTATAAQQPQIPVNP